MKGPDPVTAIDGDSSRRSPGCKAGGVRFPSSSRKLFVLVPLIACLGASLASCTDNLRQIAPDPSHFQWPVGIAADPDGNFVYVVSTNFDSACTGGTLVPVDVETGAVLSDSAVEIGSFGGEPAVTRNADGTSRIWVPVRDADSLEFADISYVPFNNDQGTGDIPVLSCGGEGFHRCKGEFRISLGPNKVVDEDGDSYFADNPYSVATGSPIVLGDGSTVRPVYVAGVKGSAMNVFLAGDDGSVRFGTAVAVSQGSHTAVEYAISGFERVVWISNRSMNIISVVRVTFDRHGNVSARSDLSGAADLLGSTGDYFRGMARSQSDRLIYAAFRSPPSLTVFEYDADGLLTYRGLVGLDGAPGGVAVHVDSQGVETVYVTESSWDFVYAIDPVAMRVTDIIFVGDAPYGIAVAGDRVFVSNFEESSVSVIEADRASPDFHREIMRIE